MGQRFRAEIIQDDKTTACGLEVPFDPKTVFGKVRAPVLVTIRKHVFRTTVFSMSGQYWIPLNKANRLAAGVAAGDRVMVLIDLDTAARTVSPPPALSAALRADTRAKAAWDKLSFTRKRELAAGIRDAKRADTKERRLQKAMAELRAK